MSDTPTLESIKAKAPEGATHYHPGLQVYYILSPTKRSYFDSANLCWVQCSSKSEVIRDSPAETIDLHNQGQPLEPNSAGLKFDTEKPRFDLLIMGMPLALEEVAKVLTVGAQKYSDHNWKRVENGYNRYLAAGMRHEIDMAKGNPLDEETGLHHLAHAACDILFRLQMELEKGLQ